MVKCNLILCVTQEENVLISCPDESIDVNESDREHVVTVNPLKEPFYKCQMRESVHK